MAIFQQHVNLTPKGKKWLENIAFSKQVANAHPGGSGAFTPDLVDHLRFANAAKNTNLNEWQGKGIHGGHVSAELQSVNLIIDPVLGIPLVKVHPAGSATITTPSGNSYAVQKFAQERWFPGQGNYVQATPLKSTFDNEREMLRLLSDVFENSVVPSLPRVGGTNIPIDQPIGGGVKVIGYVDYNPGANPEIDLKSIYLDSGTY
jgi:hypothetical protein